MAWTRETSTLHHLLQERWNEALECKGRPRKFAILWRIGNTACVKRFRSLSLSFFKGLGIPFGANVAYKPIKFKGKTRLHQVGAKLVTSSMRWEDWSLFVADCWDIQNCESISDIQFQGFKSPEVVHTDQGTHHFPCNDGSLRQS